jgi:predicted chitinase
MNQNEILVYSHLKQNGFSNNAIAAIMGVVGGESAFTDLLENSFLGTPNSSLRNIFVTRLGNKTESYINNCKTSDYDFFNCVYGGVYDNSPTEGFKYRGRGFNGITYKGNYVAMKNGIQNTYGENIDLVNNPELLERPEIAV